jgi:hypothetical protein
MAKGTYYCNELFARAYKHNQKLLQLFEDDPNSQIPSYKHVQLHHKPNMKQKYSLSL